MVKRHHPITITAQSLFPGGRGEPCRQCAFLEMCLFAAGAGTGKYSWARLGFRAECDPMVEGRTMLCILPWSDDIGSSMDASRIAHAGEQPSCPPQHSRRGREAVRHLRRWSRVRHRLAYEDDIVLIGASAEEIRIIRGVLEAVRRCCICQQIVPAAAARYRPPQSSRWSDRVFTLSRTHQALSHWVVWRPGYDW